MPVKSIAREFGITLIAMSAPSTRRYYSEREKNLCELFEEACEKAPCIIFMDEIDTKTPDRKCPEGGMGRRFVDQILTCIDNITFEKTGGKPVIIIGETNQPERQVPASRVDGRLNKEVCVRMPDKVGREKYYPRYF